MTDDPPMVFALLAICVSIAGMALLARTRRWNGAACILLMLGVLSLGLLRAIAPAEPPIPDGAISDIAMQIRPHRPGFASGNWDATILECPDHPEFEERTVAVRSERMPQAAVYEVNGRWTPPPNPRNPGIFDYGAFLEEKGASGILEVEDMDPTSDGTLPAMICTAMITRLEEAGGHPGASALARALSLGDRRGLTEGDEDAFRRAGVAHLLAISGMHIGFFGLAIRWILAGFLGRRAATVLAIIPVVGYAIVVGATPSSLRAAIIFGVYALGEEMGQKPPPSSAIALAALMLLMHDPGVLLDPGFQMSFAATSAIASTWVRMGDLPMHRWLRLPIISAAAWLATAPIALWHFDRIAPAGLLIGPLVLPIFPVVLVNGWLLGAAALSPVPDWVIRVLGEPLGLFLDLLVEIGHRMPVIDVATAAIVPAFLGATAVAILYPARRGSVAALSRRRINWVVVGCLWVLALVSIWSPAIPAPGGMRLVVFDVGQGDAILIESAAGYTMVVDAGPRWDDVVPLESSMMPYLRARGINEVDILALSHGHLDHYGGIDALNEEFDISEFWFSAPGDYRIPEVLLGRGLHMTRGHDSDLGELEISVIWPPGETMPGFSLNERSGVIMLGFGQWRGLLAGDLEGAGERALISSAGDEELAADLLKVGHHGSANASSGAFLDAVGADVAAVSVGGNRYGLPNPETMARLHRHVSTVVTTSESGAFILETDGESWRAVTMAPATPSP